MKERRGEWEKRRGGDMEKWRLGDSFDERLEIIDKRLNDNDIIRNV